jgi:hypothetical protein
VRVALLAVLLSACSFNVEGIEVVLEPDLAVGERPDLRAIDIATLCDPQGADDSCSVDHSSVLRCRSDGSGYEAVACTHGCGLTTQGARCLNLEPSGAVQASDYEIATATPTITSNVVFNTDDGSISGGLNRAAGSGLISGIYYRQGDQGAGAPKVGVFGFAALDVAPGVVIRASGRSAFAIVSSGNMTVAGTFDLQGDCAAGPSAGAGAGGVAGNGGGMGGGQAGNVGSGGKSSGGGGAGHGDVGGSGGSTMVSGGSAGLPFGQLKTEPVVLQGGGGGGAGGSGGAGGNGGGALQIAVNGTLTVKGTLHAGGCGGAAGGAAGSGGGGGAGGTILLEGAAVVLASGAVLAANGGGGGSGGGGAAGAPAAASGTPASGGAGSAPGASGGAAGSTAGKTALAGTKLAGGGGGGVGRIAVKSLAGTVDDQGASWSPSLADVNASGESPAIVGPAVFQ